MTHPLAKIRVLDLTRLIPGAIATLMLADLGADVIKLEDPNGGDYARWLGPAVDGSSVFFRANNRAKRSVILNLKESEGVAVLKKLVEKADVLVEGFRPGVMARLGCDYESLRLINGGLVYCALSGWGADGPYAQHANHDLNYVARAGLTGAMATPQVMGGQFADVGGAYIAVAGILAALFRRERTGEGAFVDAALAESALPFMLYNWTEALSMGARPGHGYLSGGMACYHVYTAHDGEPVALAALEEKFWANFCAAIERPDLVEGYLDPDRQSYLIREVSGIFSTRPAAEWESLLADKDCCFSPVAVPNAIQRDPHFQMRGMLGVHADGTPWMRSPVRVSGSVPSIENRVPGYGAHTAEVLREAGYAGEEITALASKGIIRLGS
jgi:crotonobetainyl-CoA:carnitine CoA-transferase CaiB-like acyl-CoA transferase